MSDTVGLMTPDEESFFGKLILNELQLKGLSKIIASLAFPKILGSIDNNICDKLPEPWKTNAQDLVTAFYTALQDGNISDEEIASITDKASVVLSAEIHIPLIGEDVELEAFQYLLKFLASTIKGMIAKK
jgi:hypothetical protein